ncbi:MAG: DUF1573 domain-containing protein [Phycisphaerales bacterium]|nr:MAG: DUF1573 domain-containing protein [Phycisphaerales bacterium]
METGLTQITKYLLSQSWHIAVLVLVVAIVSALLRNKSAHVRYLLWLIVLAKCLVPPLLTIPLAILPREKTPPPPAISLRMPTVNFDAVQNEAMFALPAAVREPSIIDGLAQVTAGQWLAVGWLAGLSVLLIVALVKALRTNRWLGRERKCPPARLRGDVDNLFAALDIKNAPAVWLVDGIGQPFVWGLPRGAVYLPANFAQINNPKHRRSVLMHELSHVLRLDASINLMQIIAQAIFWFHPLVWWANKKLRQEREKCCDEMAIARLEALPKDYGSAIVDTLIAERRSSRPVPSLAIAGPARNIEDRIKTIMNPGRKFYRRPGIVALVSVVLLAAVAVPTTLALTSRRADAPGENAPIAREDSADNAESNPRRVVSYSDSAESSLHAEDTRPQILFDCRIYEVSAEVQVAPDQEPAEDRTPVSVHTGKKYADRLAKLAQTESGASKLLAEPQVLILDGEEATISVESQTVCITGYLEPDQPGQEPTPITKTLLGGIKLKLTGKILQSKVTGKILQSSRIKLDIDFTRSQPAVKTRRDSKGRKIQIPLRTTNTLVSEVIVNDAQPVIIAAGESLKETDRRVVLVITPSIISTTDTKTDIATTGEPPDEPIRVVKSFVELALKGRNTEAAALAKPSDSVARQVGKLPGLLAGRRLDVQQARADGANAMVVSTFLKGDHEREGHLVFFLVKEAGRWLIENIYLESPAALQERLAIFLGEAPGAKAIHLPMPAAVRDTAQGDSMLSHAFEPKYISRTQLRESLRRWVGRLPKDTPIAAVMEVEGQLRVYGSPEAIEMAKAFVAEVDVRPGTKVSRIFELKHADCGTLAQSLSRLLDALYKDAPGQGSLGGKVTIVPDGRTNRLIVQGTAADLQKLEALIEALDVPADSGKSSYKPAGPVKTLYRIYRLEHADAGELAQTLTCLAPVIADAREGTSETAEAAGTESLIQITALAGLNQLLVVAPEHKFAELEELVRALDVPYERTGWAEHVEPADELIAEIEQIASRSGAGPGGTPEDGVTAAPRIRFEKLSHDFGEVAPGSSNTVEFKFTNEGAGTLKITKVAAACACTVAALEKKEYPPGEGGSLKVTYGAGSAAGVSTKRLYVYTNDKANPKVALTVSARIVPRIVCEPKRASILLKNNKAEFPELKISSLDGKPFSITAFEATGNSIAAEIDASRRATEFVLKPDIDPSKLQRGMNGVIEISLSHPQCKRVSIRFDVLPEFKINPPVIIIWDAEPGKTVSRDLWLLNNYGEDFTVESISSSNDFVKVQASQKIANGYKMRLGITPPPAEGRSRFTDDVLIKTSPGDGELRIICRGFYARGARPAAAKDAPKSAVKREKDDAANTLQLETLKAERDMLAREMETLRSRIAGMVEGSGSTVLREREEGALKEVGRLLKKLTEAESRRIRLQIKIALFEKAQEPVGPGQLLAMRQQYINDDPTVKALSERIAQLRVELLTLSQTYSKDHPEHRRKADLLDSLVARLDQARANLAKAVDELISEQASDARKQQLTELRAELEQSVKEERDLRDLLVRTDRQAVTLGQQQLLLLKLQLDLSTQKHEDLCLRIEELEKARRKRSVPSLDF